ncbi:MAG: phosphatase PAP2 family protein, partial [bacterium]
LIIYLLLILSIAILPEKVLSRNIDEELFNYIHNDIANKALDSTLPVVQRMGDPKVYLALCAMLCGFGDERMFEIGKLASAGFVETGVLVYILKTFVGRPRPNNSLEKDSFPSGHSAFAFTIATIAGKQYPFLRIPLYITATGTSFARIYLGRHYPSDVIVGCLIGVLVGLQMNHYKSAILSLSF